jgi:hypothetical protein
MEAEPLKVEMIGVTLLAVPLGYLGWQSKIVRERRSYLHANTHEGIPAEVAAASRVPTKGASIPPFDYGWFPVEFAPGDKTQAPAGIRIWLGDEVQDFVWVNRAASLEDKQAVAALFPEADVLEWTK